MNEHALLDFLSRYWLAVAAAGVLVWTIESTLEGKTIREALIGPVLVCGWLGVTFLLDRWALRHADRQND